MNHFPTSINGACIKSLEQEYHPSIYHLVRLTPLIVAIALALHNLMYRKGDELSRAFDPSNCIISLRFNGGYFAVRSRTLLMMVEKSLLNCI